MRWNGIRDLLTLVLAYSVISAWNLAFNSRGAGKSSCGAFKVFSAVFWFEQLLIQSIQLKTGAQSFQCPLKLALGVLIYSGLPPR